MQHLLFGIVSALIGINLIAVSGAVEHGTLPSLSDFTKEVTAEAPSSASPPHIPFTERFVDDLFTDRGEKKEAAYNIKSEKVIESVSENATIHSSALIPCDHPDAKCYITETPTITPTPYVETPTVTSQVQATITPKVQATLTPSPTPTFVVVEPTLFPSPPCGPFPVTEQKQLFAPEIPCVHIEHTP